MGFQGKIGIDPSKPHRGGDDQKKKKYAGEKLQKLKFSSFFFLSVFPPPGSTGVQAVPLSYIPVERSTYL